jgi:diacylglycerol kinase (ATP)
MPGRRFTVVVNPRGGTQRGLAVLEQVRPMFASEGAELDVHVTEYAGHTTEIAKNLDLECREPLVAAQRIVAGRTRPLDVARVSMREGLVYCVNIIGWGAIADINGTAERLRLLGPPRYALAALLHILRPKRRRARLVLDGQAFDDDFHFIIACNTKTTGSGMILAPHAEIGDGKIDVVALRSTSRRQLLKVFRKVFDGSHLSLPRVSCHQVRSFMIACERPGVSVLDGADGPR